MTLLRAAQAASLIVLVTLAGIAGEIVFLALNWNTRTVTAGEPVRANALELLGWMVAQLTFAIGGALIVSRQHRNPVGWALVAFAIGTVTAGTLGGYVLHAVITNPGSLPRPEIAAWIETVVTETVLFMWLGIVFLLLPNGTLLSLRWRWVLRGSLSGGALAIVGMLAPGDLTYYPLEDDITLRNPFGFGGAGPLLDGAAFLGFLLQFGAMLASLLCVFLRFRRSRGVERQEMKWFALAGFVVFAVWGVIPAIASLTGLPASFGNVLSIPGFLAIPVATGIAVLRHNLYDIDLILNRTLVYGLLTSVLLGVYVALVITLGSVSRAAFGRESALVVAASTLAVAALFGPLRSIIQRDVDRRFYRLRYDAGIAIEIFGERVRRDVDLRTLSEEVQSVIQETMQPAHVSLWLRHPLQGAERTEGQRP